MENDSLFPDYDGSLAPTKQYKGVGAIVIIAGRKVIVSEYEGYVLYDHGEYGSVLIEKDGNVNHRSESIENAHRWIDVITGKVR